MFWNYFKKPAASQAVKNTQGLYGQSIKLPSTYLQKLIPIGEMPVEQLNALNVTARQFRPVRLFLPEVIESMCCRI
jgi:hypothetical protein